MLCDRSRDQIISVSFAKFNHTIMQTGLSNFRVTNLVAKLGLESNMFNHLLQFFITNHQQVCKGDFFSLQEVINMIHIHIQLSAICKSHTNTNTCIQRHTTLYYIPRHTLHTYYTLRELQAHTTHKHRHGCTYTKHRHTQRHASSTHHTHITHNTYI